MKRTGRRRRHALVPRTTAGRTATTNNTDRVDRHRRQRRLNDGGSSDTRREHPIPALHSTRRTGLCVVSPPARATRDRGNRCRASSAAESFLRGPGGWSDAHRSRAIRIAQERARASRQHNERVSQMIHKIINRHASPPTHSRTQRTAAARPGATSVALPEAWPAAVFGVVLEASVAPR
jgi:hypothetical protein